MRLPTLAVPLLIALLPLAAMAILQFAMPVIAPMVMADLGRPAHAYGWLGGALGLGSVLLLVTSQVILPALGPVRALQAGLVTAIAGVGCVMTGIWPLMLFGSFLIGIGYATTTPAGSQILADFTPRALWGTLFSLRMAAVPLGGIMAGLLGSLVAPAHGWRLVFAVVVAICIFALVVLLAMPRRFNEARALRPLDIRSFTSAATYLRPLHTLARVPGLRSLGFAAWCLACVHAVVTTFYVIYLVGSRGMDLAKAASLFAGLHIAAAIGRVFFGALADRLGSPLPVLKVLAPASGCTAVLLSVMTANWSMPALVIATIYIGTVVGAFTGLYLAEVARLAPAAEVGDATASVAAFVFTAYLIMPPLAGLGFTWIGAVPTLRLLVLFAVTALTVFVWRDRLSAPDVAKGQ